MQKKICIILLTVLVFLSGTVLGISTVYRIKDVTVDVLHVTEEALVEGEELQQRLQDAYRGSSTFFVKDKKAKEILENYPYFRLSSFDKVYPGRLIIKVAEDAEVYALQKAEGEYFILGSDGTVLDIRNTHVNMLNGAENVVLTGLNVAGESGKIPTGDECFANMLSICEEISQLLGGIRSNVVSVEVFRRTPQMIYRITMREGVKIYIGTPMTQTKEKTQKAVEQYLLLSYDQKLSGCISVSGNGQQIMATYSKKDPF